MASRNFRVQVYDLIMLIVLGMSAIFGAIKGLAWQIASLASITVSYVVACTYRERVAQMIDATPPWNMFLAMLILYVGTGFAIWVGFRLMSSAIDKIRMKQFDRQLGALFGLGKGVIFCLLITMFAMTLLGPKQQAAICQSRSGYYISAFLGKAVVLLPKEVHSSIGEYLAKLDNRLREGQLNPQSLDNRMIGMPQIPASLEQLLPGQSNPATPANTDNWLNGFPPQGQPNAQPNGFPGLGGFGGALIDSAADRLSNPAATNTTNNPTQSGGNWPTGLRPAGESAELPRGSFLQR
jgi:membrane protein required for colicin V production